MSTGTEADAQRIDQCALCRLDILRDEPRTVFHSIQAYLHKPVALGDEAVTRPCFTFLTDVAFHGRPWDPSTCPGTSETDARLPIHNRCQAVLRRAAKRRGITPPGGPSKKRGRSKPATMSGSKSKRVASAGNVTRDICTTAHTRALDETITTGVYCDPAKSETSTSSIPHGVQRTNPCHEKSTNMMQQLYQTQLALSQVIDRWQNGQPVVSVNQSQFLNAMEQLRSALGVDNVSQYAPCAAPPGVIASPEAHSSSVSYDDNMVPSIAGAPVPAPTGLYAAVDDECTNDALSPSSRVGTAPEGGSASPSLHRKDSEKSLYSLPPNRAGQQFGECAERESLHFLSEAAKLISQQSESIPMRRDSSAVRQETKSVRHSEMFSWNDQQSISNWYKNQNVIKDEVLSVPSLGGSSLSLLDWNMLSNVCS